MIELNRDNSYKICLSISPSGKAPKIYGENALRFSEYELSVLLPKRNWTLIKKTKNYVYFVPPNNYREPFKITVEIPKREYALELAKECYLKKESVLDQIGEWPLGYSHDRNMNMIEYKYDTERREQIEILHENPPESFFIIGGDLWSFEVRIAQGEFKIHENTRNIIENKESIFKEGKKFDLTLTKYERNREARNECLMSYGYTCQICGFNFEEVYGNIGKHIIHVHHLIPISAIKEEYIIDPINDLIPVCPNCHTVIHSNSPIYDIEFIKRNVESKKN